MEPDDNQANSQTEVNLEGKEGRQQRELSIMNLLEKGDDNLPALMHALSLSSLLSNDPIIETTLSLLNTDQLTAMEKAIAKVKRSKKNKNGKLLSLSPGTHCSLEEGEEQDAAILKEIAQLPAIYLDNGIEWMTFIYSSRGVEQSFNIRIDIETLENGIDDFPSIFKINNCLYPRAYCSKEEYIGNRWEYETMCNSVGWRLAHLNPDILGGKRGLLQRAVDSYRNRQPGLQSRRVARQGRMLNNSLKKRITPAINPPKNKDNAKTDNLDTINNPTDIQQVLNKCLPIPTTLTITLYFQTKPLTFIIKADIHNVSLDEISDEFKKAYAVYPRSLPENQNPNKKSKKQELEEQCNEWGWKLAHLNPELFKDNILFLQKALDHYRENYTLFPPRPYRLKKANH